MARKVASVALDAAIARIAANQHGVVSTTQLLAAGLHSSGIADRASAGRLHRIHRGVYAVGHPRLSQEGMWMAAVLACGPDAVLSHISAARLWRLLPRPRPGSRMEDPSPIHVTIPSPNGRTHRDGLRIHRTARLDHSHVTRRGNIPVTSPARTLEDLRRSGQPKQFAAALREAEFLRLPIGDRFRPDHTRTELEAELLALCRRYRLPKPEVNVPIDRFVVDALWRERDLIVEVDGWQSHGTRSAFEGDRARDARLKVLGYDVMRFTWRQITAESRGVAGTIRAVLGHRKG